MKSIKLSEKFTIYVDTYNNEYSVDEFLKYVDINDKMATHTNDNSVWIEIETECFHSINSYIKNRVQEISNRQYLETIKKVIGEFGFTLNVVENITTTYNKGIKKSIQINLIDNKIEFSLLKSIKIVLILLSASNCADKLS